MMDRTTCPICRDTGPRDVLLDLDVAWVTAPRSAPLPGYVCVVAKRHVVEPFELERSEGHAFWDTLMNVARGLQAGTGAAKMNYEIHGNTIPHLHVHLFPRYPNDPFEGRPIDPTAAEPFSRTDDDLARLRRAIRAVVG